LRGGQDEDTLLHWLHGQKPDPFELTRHLTIMAHILPSLRRTAIAQVALDIPVVSGGSRILQACYLTAY